MVAVEDHDGKIVYEYGWLSEDGATFDFDASPGRQASYETTISWAGSPQRSYRYPTDEDFSKALPPTPRALTP